MARAKRANQHDGTEEPQWPANGTADEGREDAARNGHEPPDHHATGTNGHSGPRGQIGPSGLPAHETQTEHDPVLRDDRSTEENGRSADDSADLPVNDAQSDEQTAHTAENVAEGNKSDEADATQADAAADEVDTAPDDGEADGERDDDAAHRADADRDSKAAGEEAVVRHDEPAAEQVVEPGGEVAGEEAVARDDEAAAGEVVGRDDDKAAGEQVVERGGEAEAELGRGDESAEEAGLEREGQELSQPRAWQLETRPAREHRPAGFETPIRVDEIVVAAKALSEGLHAATEGLSEAVEARPYRRELDDAADTIRAVAGELESTAGQLVRLAAAQTHTCDVAWGICPEHGLTLVSIGETVTCRVLGCHQVPEGVVERCGQPVAYKVVDVSGPAMNTCAGHAIACRLHLESAVITLATDSLELL